MLKIFSKKQKGFTLVELLVVIAIIGTLASIVLVSMSTVRPKARDAIRKAHMRQVIAAQELCYDDSACGAEDAYLTSATTPTAISTYLPSMPTNPGGGATYDYVWLNNTTNDQAFCLYGQEEGPTTATYVVASERGFFECTLVPTLADCCFP